MLTCLAVAALGCKEAEEKRREATRRAKEKASVTAEDRELAEERLRKLWAEVEPLVDKYNPSDEDRPFYRDLVVLTRFAHRLAGMGKVKVTVTSADGEVKSSRVMDRLVSREQALEKMPLSAEKLEAIKYAAKWLGWFRTPGIPDRMTAAAEDPGVKPDKVDIEILDAPGSLATSRYVENRLKQIGVDELYVQTFPVVQPITTECRLSVNGREVTSQAIYGMDASQVGCAASLFLVGASGGSYLSPGPLHAGAAPVPLGAATILGYPSRPVIYQVRPNILQASVTPAEGLSGKTLYIKDGSIENYLALPEDKIVVLDFDCMKNWLDAFAFGARAAIFIGPADGRPAARAYHHLNVPANLPRFYVPAKVADKVGLADSRHVTIKSACRWDRLEGRSVIGVIRGSDPKFGKEQPQAIVLAAALDSLSEVPYLSPGARDAANCAALLEVARYLRGNQPKRDVILCFFDGQAQNNLGARAFYGNTRRETITQANSIEKLVAMHDDEMMLRSSVMTVVARLRQRFKLIDQAAERGGARPKAQEGEIERLSLFSDETKNLPRHKDVLEVFRTECRNLGSKAIDVIPPLRLSLDDLEKQLAEVGQVQAKLAGDRDERRRNGQPIPEKLSKELDDLGGRIERMRKKRDKLSRKIAVLEVDDLAWNSIERVLYEKLDVCNPEHVRQMHSNISERHKREALIRQTPRKFRKLIQHTKEVCLRRTSELKNAKARADQSKMLRDALGPSNNNVLLHLSINFGDRRKRWAFIHGDDSLVSSGSDPLVNYKTILSVLERLATEKLKDEVGDLHPDSVDLTYPNRLLAPAKFADSACIARIFGVYNLSVMTAMDPMARQGQPVDTLENLNEKNVVAQLRQFAPLLKDFADDGELKEVASKIRPSAQYTEPEWTSGGSSGTSVRLAGGGSAMAEQRVRDAIVAAGPRHPGPWNAGTIEKMPPGFQYPLIVATDANGSVELPAHSQPTYRTVVLFAATFDEPSDEAKGSAALSRGLITIATSAKTMIGGGGGAKRAVIQFKSKSKTFVGYGFDRGAMPTDTLQARSTAKLQDDKYLSCELGDVVTIYAEDRIEAVKLFNRAGMVILNNDDTASRYKGTGVSIADQFSHPVTPICTARSLRNLNQHRLKLLRRNRITQESLEVRNGRASDLLQDAEIIKADLEKEELQQDREQAAEKSEQPAATDEAGQERPKSEGSASPPAAKQPSVPHKPV
jgi:hypothetical protein